VYVNAVADNVTLQSYFRHDFITIFKIKRNLYIASGSASPHQVQILGVHLVSMNNI